MAGELVLFQNIGYTHAAWTFRDRAGKWSAQGQLKWPWGAEYDTTRPIRVCYPNVALRGRAVHFFGVSDVVEPYKAWREFKRELTGQQWDYDFRRLFYTWTRDITKEPFAEWVEIASRDKTAGWVSPGDLWLAPNNDVHLLWSERAIDERLREKFFPEAKQSHALNYALVREGKVVRRRTLMESTEDKPGIAGSAGRFHVTPDNRLFVVCYASGTEAGGRSVAENRIMEILPDGAVGAPVRLPLTKPFTSYFTTTVRGGSPPSQTLEMLGAAPGRWQRDQLRESAIVLNGCTRRESSPPPSARIPSRTGWRRCPASRRCSMPRASCSTSSARPASTCPPMANSIASM